MRRLPFFLLFLLLGVVRISPGADLKIPYLSGPLVDEAGLLSPDERTRVESAVLELDHAAHIQMAILVPKSLQGEDIASYSIAVAEKWQLGKKGEDRGLLFIIAPNERKMRMEVGYGLEGNITDATSRRILDDIVAPYFRVQHYGDGMIAATQGVARALSVDISALPDQAIAPERHATHPLLLLLLIGFLVFWFFMNFFLPGGGWFSGGGYGGGFGGGGFGGGGFGGGGFSGGGGGFGGGGASGSW